MSFLWPRMLWLLALIPLILAAYLLAQRRRQRYALRYASLSLVREALGRGPGIRRHVPAMLLLASLAILVFALARPAATINLPSERGTVILAFDVSGSMRADDVKPTRLDAAKEAARGFVERQPTSVNIGVVAFSDGAQLVQAPTNDRSQVLASIDRLWPQRGTAIGWGLVTALEAVYEQYGVGPIPPQPDMQAMGQQEFQLPPAPAGGFPSAVIVLLSDGQSNRGPDPLEVVSQTMEAGVRIFTVGVGSPQGTVLRFRGMSIRVFLDEQTLKKIAQTTNAAYFRAGTGADLRRIYRTLSTQFVVEKKQTELAALAAGAAGLVLLAAGALSVLWFGRLP